MIRDVLGATLVTAWVVSAFAAPANYVQLMRAKAAGKPNLILIVAQGVGYGDLGCYGQQRIRTPNLDRMAGEGIRFTQWYAGSPDATASRASLLTGHRAGHGVLSGPFPPVFEAETLTLATLLQDAGYKTGAVGVWGFAKPGSQGTPNRQGFDEWLGFLDAERAQDYFPAILWRDNRRQNLPTTVMSEKNLYAPTLFKNAVLNFVRSYKSFPFFVYWASPLLHANGPLTRLTGNGMQVPTPHAYSKEDWPEPERNKAAMISLLDDSVGELLDLLDELDLAHDTLVVFTSASGPQNEGGVDPSFHRSAGPFRGVEGNLTEGGLRVPCIARWKGRVPAGKVLSEPSAHWDFAATIATLALTNFPIDIDGLSLVETLTNAAASPVHEPFYWETETPNPTRAVRSGPWKLILDDAGDSKSLELYNLDEDPGESRNVEQRYPEILKELQTELDFGKAPQE